MKAVVAHRYGPPEVLELEDVAIPEPGPGQALVRVLASSVNPVDWHTMRGSPLPVRLTSGLTRPGDGHLGADLAGVVEAVGPGVTTVRPGDEVLGMGRRAWAELAVVSAEGIVARPPAVSWAEAGCVGVAGITALQGLRTHGGLTAGQRVLVAGAGGGVGHFAVQIAKAAGAHVTATTSGDKVAFVRELGADEVADRDRSDPAGEAGAFDLILDAGGWLGLRRVRRALRPGGVAVLCGAGPSMNTVSILGGMAAARVLSRGDRRLVQILARRTPEDLETLRAMLADGTLRPRIARTYPMAEVRAAVAAQERGATAGKVALSIP